MKLHFNLKSKYEKQIHIAYVNLIHNTKSIYMQLSNIFFISYENI